MRKAKAQGAAVPIEVRDPLHVRVAEIINAQTGTDAKDVTLDSTLDDLGMDSLDFIEVVMELEEQLGRDLDEEQLSQAKTVGEALKLLSSDGNKT